MNTPHIPIAPTRKRRLTISFLWLLPLLAVAIGIGLVVHHVLNTGPQISITFDTAEGLTAGKTEVRYKEVTVGRVTGVELIDNARRVSVTVRLDKSASEFAADDARYWVIRPRVGLGGVSGLGTLLSGAFIGVDRGKSEKTTSRFEGLEAPPLVMRGDSGRTVNLKASNLGSLDIASPVYFRNLTAGRVVSYDLADDGAHINLRLFIDAPYDRLIHRDTRFWNASGLDFSVSARGIKVDTQSLMTIVAGGISFGFAPDAGVNSRADGSAAAPAPTDAVFRLFDDQQQALEPPDGAATILKMVFPDMVRGLVADALVEFLGVNVGSITSVSLSFEPDGQRFSSIVTARVYPERLGKANEQILENAGRGADPQAAVFRTFVERGLRAQLRTGNLLTGQLYVSLDFHKEAEPADFRISDNGLYEIPTIRSTLDQLEPQVAQIVARLNRFKFDEIGNELTTTLQGFQAMMKDGQLAIKSADRTFASTRSAVRGLSSETAQTLTSLQETLDQARRNLLVSDAPMQRNLNETLAQLQRASQSLRVLADYLQQHPESLLRGKRADEPLR